MPGSAKSTNCYAQIKKLQLILLHTKWSKYLYKCAAAEVPGMISISVTSCFFQKVLDVSTN